MLQLSVVALLALPLTSGCGAEGADGSSASASGPSSPRPAALLPQEGAPAAVRGLGPALEVSIDPYVLHVAPDAVTLAWTTRAAVVGKATLASEDGVVEAVEAAPTRHHRVRFEGLRAGTTHRWRVGEVHEGIVRTPMPDGARRFAVFGHPGGTSLNEGYPYAALGHTLEGLALDFALCTGDLCYFTHESSFGELFMRPFRGFLSQAPIYVAAGNHDGGYPVRYAWDYTVFRQLFPYDYPSERGAYHSFVRGNVHFLSVVYHPIDGRDLEEQLAWIRAELAGSRSEFRVAFLGGANRPTDGSFERLTEALAEGGVDAIFGGDGSGTEQGELAGVPYFYAGTRQQLPPNFYQVDARPYELVVTLREASMTNPPRTWVLGSRRPKRLVRDLLPAAKAKQGVPRAVELTGLDVESVEFHGLRISLRNDTDRPLPVYLRWGERPTGEEGGAGRMFREQAVRVAPGTLSTFDMPLPARNPITGAPWTLFEAELRIESPGLPADYRLLDELEALALFVDPLRTDD